LDYSYVVEEIIEGFRLRKLSLWVGSGISRDPPAALPLANELKSYVLRQVCDTKDLREVYENRLMDEKDIGTKIRSYPLEAFIERISETHSILDSIAKLFRLGDPNDNHNTIAALVKKGLLRDILTTNFDILLEKALERIGWAVGTDFQVLFNDSEFFEIGDQNPLPTILKIHGSAINVESMRITLSQVAGKALALGKVKALQQFLTAEEGGVLVLGYSASDEFDINPILSTIHSKKKIYFLAHGPGKHEIGELPRPFGNCDGQSLICHTGEVIQHIRRAFLNA
jgi:hypothetical protein